MVVDESEEWSSQLIFQLSNWKEEAWKKSGFQRDSNLWSPRMPMRCSTNLAMKPHIGSEVILLAPSYNV